MPAHPQMPVDGRNVTGEIPLPKLVRSVAAELARATGAAEALQRAIRLDGCVEASDGASMRSAQGLDLLTQELDGLRSFMQNLADLVPEDWHVDPRPAAREIVLSGLKDRLSSSGRHGPPQPSQDVEFF